MTTLQSIKNGERFWLADKGTGTQIHEIGPYALLEYIHNDKTNYTCFVDGNSIGQSFDDFETALANAMAVKFDGINTQAGIFFGRMIKSNMNG